MKKVNIIMVIAAGFLLSTAVLNSCNAKDEKTDESKEVAAEVNDKKFENKASENDAQFVVDAMSASFDEIRIADVGLAKSKNAEVQKIAQQLKTDHSAMITELNGVASKSAITVPAISSEDASKFATRLMETDAKEFDKKWLDRVKEMNEASLKKYDNASKDATDINIKSWAAATSVKIRSHLDIIRSTRDMMK